MFCLHPHLSTPPRVHPFTLSYPVQLCGPLLYFSIYQASFVLSTYLDTWPSPGAWLTYQGSHPSSKLTLPLQAAIVVTDLSARDGTPCLTFLVCWDYVQLEPVWVLGMLSQPLWTYVHTPALLCPENRFLAEKHGCLWLLESFPPFFPSGPWALGRKVWCRYPASSWVFFNLAFSASWPAVGLRVNQHLNFKFTASLFQIWIQHRESNNLTDKIPNYDDFYLSMQLSFERDFNHKQPIINLCTYESSYGFLSYSTLWLVPSLHVSTSPSSLRTPTSQILEVSAHSSPILFLFVCMVFICGFEIWEEL